MRDFSNPKNWHHVYDIDYCSNVKVYWAIGFPDNHLVEEFPSGTKFNVSIPWYLRWLFNPHNPKYFLAALLHDTLLKRGYDRITASGAFNHGLKAEGVPYITRLIMTTGVFLFKYE